MFVPVRLVAHHHQGDILCTHNIARRHHNRTLLMLLSGLVKSVSDWAAVPHVGMLYFKSEITQGNIIFEGPR